MPIAAYPEIVLDPIPGLTCVDHVYKLHSRVIPSVTHILGDVLEIYNFIPPKNLAKAADLGTLIHDMTEYSDAGTLAKHPYFHLNEVTPYLEAWEKFKRDLAPKFLASEVMVYHPVYGYAGTADRVAQMCGGVYVLEVKTGGKLSAHEVQLSAYARALARMITPPTSIRTATVYLTPKGPEVCTYPDTGDAWCTFISCLNIYNFRRRKNARS